VDGKFYGFADGVITVLEPDTGVASNITTDHLGAPFTDSNGTTLAWGDAVYMEVWGMVRLDCILHTVVHERIASSQ
jgi:hypothetical protein